MEVMYYRAWNTKNPYTKHGQRIGYAVLTDKMVIFNDIDRGITGHVKPDFEPEENHPTRIMHAYMHSLGELYWSNPDTMPYELFHNIARKAGEYAEKHAPTL